MFIVYIYIVFVIYINVCVVNVDENWLFFYFLLFGKFWIILLFLLNLGFI